MGENDGGKGTYGPYEGTSGAPAVLWAVAAAPEPLTTAEIAAILGAHKSTVSSTCTRLWRTGYVLRRRRGERVEGSGPSYYEYTIAVPEELLDDGYADYAAVDSPAAHGFGDGALDDGERDVDD